MLLPLLNSLGLGIVGGLAFDFAGLPLPWMLGPLVVNLAASISGARVAVPEKLRMLFLGVLGLVLGSQVTPELASRVIDWPVSGALLLIGVAVSTWACAAWFRWRGFDATTALFAAAPGALTAMIMMGEASGGDPRKIAISQSLRIVLVLLILPPLFWFYEGSAGADVSATAGGGFSATWLLLALPLLIPLGIRLRLPTPALMMPLLVSALLSGFDIARFDMPDWGVNAMLLVLGSSIGARFRGMTPRVLRKHLKNSFTATLIALAIMGLFAEITHQILGTPRDIALLAMAPGGIGEMAILAVALGLDPMFIAFHHLLRVVALMAAAPFLARWMQARRD